MAQIIYSHPKHTNYGYHVYTDLDFWDALRILKDLAEVRRNFGPNPPGDEFPTQVMRAEPNVSAKTRIEKRLGKAIASPARHVIVRSMIFEKSFEFDPAKYYPAHWSHSRMLHFTYHRLPLEQPVLCNTYRDVKLSWVGRKIRVEQIQRTGKYDPVIRTKKEARRRLRTPSCF